MKLKAKRLKILAVVIFLMIAISNLWTLRPVNIIHTSKQREIIYDVVVDHFPFTDRDRVHWYLDHKLELQEKYGIPGKSGYAITIWDVGAGFLSFKGNTKWIDDLYCFDNINKDERCIEKNIPLVVYLSENNKEVFNMGYSGYSYTLDKDGKLSATRDEELFEHMRSRYK